MDSTLWLDVWWRYFVEGRRGGGERCSGGYVRPLYLYTTTELWCMCLDVLLNSERSALVMRTILRYGITLLPCYQYFSYQWGLRYLFVATITLILKLFSSIVVVVLLILWISYSTKPVGPLKCPYYCVMYGTIRPFIEKWEECACAHCCYKLLSMSFYNFGSWPPDWGDMLKSAHGLA